MFKKSLQMVFVVVCIVSFSQVGFSQFRGLQVRVGGYGGGVSVNGYNFNNNRNGYNGAYNGYSTGYGSRYGTYYGNNFGSNYGSGYQNGYGYSRPSNGVYIGNGYGNGFTYRSNPSFTYRYGTPRYYGPPTRRMTSRRYR